MSALRDRSNRLRPKSRGKYISFFGAITLLVLPNAVTQANATAGQTTAAMYLDQPFVQGSYVGENYPSETSVTTFNDQTPGSACSFNGATFTPLYSETFSCSVGTELNYGGASTTSSTPNPGVYPEPGRYGSVGSGGAAITFNTPQTYFGLWWSAGSVGNQIQLLSGSDIVASTSANDVANSLLYTSSVSAQNGDSYATSYYIGQPLDWFPNGEPTDFANQDLSNNYISSQTYAQEPFVFIHFIAEPGVTFDRVNLLAPGNGFEFDNFTTSTATGISPAEVGNRLVLQSQLYEPTYVEFDANGGDGALPRQASIDGQSGNLQPLCISWGDPTRCITSPDNNYPTYFTGWNTERDGSGESVADGGSFPFTETTTLYAQWQTDFTSYNLTNPDPNVDSIFDYVDYGSLATLSIYNLGDFSLPSPSLPGYYLEGWYTVDPTWTSLFRVGGAGEVISAGTYTTWANPYLFARWLEDTPPPPSVDAITPEVLLVYPRSTSVELPSMPITGDTSAAICLVESDITGTPVASSLSFTDLSTARSGMSTSYTISDTSSLVTSSSRYIRVTVSLSSDLTCTSGLTHIIEVRPIGANFTKIVPLNLTAR